MNLKILSVRKKQQAQSTVEYIIMLLVITIGIMIFFGVSGGPTGPSEFEPARNQDGQRDNFFNKLRIKAAFDSAVSKAAEELNKQ